MDGITIDHVTDRASITARTGAASRHHRDTVRAINDEASAFEGKAGYPRTHKPFPISFAASTN